jgi:hypothetical protein
MPPKPRPKRLGDFDVALKVRDTIQRIAEEVVDKKRPRAKEAAIVDYDRDKLTAEVVFPGDTQSVEARFPANLQPRRKKNDNETGDAVGDIVVVEGHPGNYRITGFVHGTARSEGSLLVGTQILTLNGIEEVLAEMLPQPGDCRFTFRSVSGGGVILPGNWVLCDNSLVTRSAPFNKAWEALGSPANGTDGTNWRLQDGRDRAPWGVGDDVSLMGDEGEALGIRAARHRHGLDPSADHVHGIPSDGDHAHGGNTGGNNATAVDRATGGLGTAAQGHTHSMPNGGGHAHTGTVNANGSHSHGGETGNGSATTQIMGWKGVNWLMKL